MPTSPTGPDLRVHTTLAHLRSLEFHARGFSFLPRRKLNSVLNGRYSSRVRGRGLNFEELRDYRPGDDVRAIDWKVTARTRKPYVRIFTEERDRPTLVVVDQRLSMFFGSVLNMKSVTAAEVAALTAWRVLAAGDRVGGVVFDDAQVSAIRPRRSRGTVNRLLHEISRRNQSLRADSSRSPTSAQLAVALDTAANLAQHDHLVVVLSDFDGGDERAERAIARLSRHNDVVLGLVHDPLARELPTTGELVIGDGRLQVQLDFANEANRNALGSVSRSRLERIMAWQLSTGAAVLPVSAGEDSAAQLRRLLGRGPRLRAAAPGLATAPPLETIPPPP